MIIHVQFRFNQTNKTNKQYFLLLFSAALDHYVTLDQIRLDIVKIIFMVVGCCLFINRNQTVNTYFLAISRLHKDKIRFSI